MRRLLAIIAICVFCSCIVQAQTGPSVQTFGQASSDPGLWDYTRILRLGAAPMSSPVNEFGVTAECTLAVTTATAPYEKICFIPWVTQTDPSDYSKNVTKDGVAIDARCYIDGNNKTGRCWGMYLEAGPVPGSDGMAVGLEIGGDNKGKDQPLAGQIDSKGLLSLVAGENGATAPISGFARMVPGSQAAHWGFIGETAAFVEPDAPVFAVQSNTTGAYIAGLFADGTVSGRHIVELINTQGLNPKLLPTMKRGEVFYWGDTSTGQSYLAYFDGQGYALIPTAKYIKSN